jgi:hypothetical protein
MRVARTLLAVSAVVAIVVALSSGAKSRVTTARARGSCPAPSGALSFDKPKYIDTARG